MVLSICSFETPAKKTLPGIARAEAGLKHAREFPFE
jgi:hypothetical protein